MKRLLLITVLMAVLVPIVAQAIPTSTETWQYIIDRLDWAASYTGYPKSREQLYPLVAADMDSSVMTLAGDSLGVRASLLAANNSWTGTNAFAESTYGAKAFQAVRGRFTNIFATGGTYSGRLTATDLILTDTLSTVTFVATGTAAVTGRSTFAAPVVGADTGKFANVVATGTFAVTGASAHTGRSTFAAPIVGSDTVKGVNIVATGTANVTGASTFTGGITIGASGDPMLKGRWSDAGDTVYIVVVGTETLAMRPWHP